MASERGCREKRAGTVGLEAECSPRNSLSVDLLHKKWMNTQLRREKRARIPASYTFYSRHPGASTRRCHLREIAGCCSFLIIEIASDRNATLAGSRCHSTSRFLPSTSRKTVTSNKSLGVPKNIGTVTSVSTGTACSAQNRRHQIANSPERCL